MTGWVLRAGHPDLVGRTGRGVRIAVIDSGANVPHPHLPAIGGGMAFTLEGEPAGDTLDRLGHGTAVAAAIHERAPEAELLAVKVFDRALATSVPTLVRALDWSSDAGARLVNLSLGTPNPFRKEPLAAAVARAAERGTLVVSATGHGGEVWYPGVLPAVVGVGLLEELPRDSVVLEELEGGGWRLLASPYPRPIPGVPPERNLSGISFAVANATGLLALLLEACPGIATVDAVLTTLQELAVREG